MLETIAAIFTVITGAWFVFEKARTIVIRRKPKPAQVHAPLPVHPRHGSTLEAIVATLASGAARYQLYQASSDKDPISPEQLGPWAATGDFFGTGRPAYALYVKNQDSKFYSLVVIGSPDNGAPRVFDVDNDIASARYMYLERARPGKYAVGPSVRKQGQPRSVRISVEGILSGTFESAVRVIWWDKKEGRFREQWLSD